MDHALIESDATPRFTRRFRKLFKKVIDFNAVQIKKARRELAKAEKQGPDNTSSVYRLKTVYNQLSYIITSIDNKLSIAGQEASFRFPWLFLLKYHFVERNGFQYGKIGKAVKKRLAATIPEGIIDDDLL